MIRPDIQSYQEDLEFGHDLARDESEALINYVLRLEESEERLKAENKRLTAAIDAVIDFIDQMRVQGYSSGPLPAEYDTLVEIAAKFRVLKSD